MVKKITHTQLARLVTHLYNTKTAKGTKLPMIVYGTFGVGKSTIIQDKAKEISEKKGKEYVNWNEVTRAKKNEINENPEKFFVLVDIRLSEFDSSDIKGLPDFKDDDSVEWKIPFWAKVLENPKSDGILFFDEINLACEKGNTKILTTKGYKRIRDINKGDMVLDIKGIYSKVLATQKTLYQEEIYKIKATGIRKIETTFNHPFYVIEKYRKANSKHNVKQTISKPIWKMAEKLKKGDYVGIKIPNKTQLSNNLKNKDIDFAKLCGMYVGNGWVEKNKNNTSYRLGLSYGIYKTKEIKEVEETLKKMFSNKLQISQRENAIVYRVTISKKIYNFLKNECGHTAKQKKIPFEILNSDNKKIMINFLKGYIQADGCFMKNENLKSKSKIGIATSSENLALGLQFMIARLGYLATINKDDKIRTNYIKGRKITYEGGFTLRITNTGFQKLLNLKYLERARETEHYFKHNGFIWVKIRNIKKEVEGCNVYNFEVENNNTYTANNILTHNTPLVISSTYKIIHDRVVNESKINNNWLILCAGNKDEDRAYTHELASPVRDRACEVELTPPNIDDWTNWATGHGIDGRIIGFLNWKPSNLHKVDFDDGQKFTTERGWERLHYLIQGITDYRELDLVSGTAISEGIAREFTAFCKIKDNIKLDEIIKNPDSFKKVEDISIKYFVVTALAEHYKDKKVTFEKLLDISRVLDEMKNAEFIALLWKLASRYAKERFRKDFTTKDLDNPLRAKFHEYLVK